MSRSLPEHELAARIEAALYSAGRPLALSELIIASGSNSKKKTIRVINELMIKTKTTFRALEISQLDDHRYVFQLKREYTPLIRRFAQRPIIGSAALKTLSYVAYEQPVSSKRLCQIRGSQVYNHLRELENSSFISHERIGRSNVYKTTTKFQDYFGIEDLGELKNRLIKPK